MKFILIFFVNIKVTITFTDVICPKKWIYGFDFSRDYDSNILPLYNKQWSNSNSALYGFTLKIINSPKFKKCITTVSKSAKGKCKDYYIKSYLPLLGIAKNNVLRNVICYHICLMLLKYNLIPNDQKILQACPTPCHQKPDICKQRHGVLSVKCYPVSPIIFNHNYRCSCIRNYYWDPIKLRCIKINPCENKKYYPCYFPGTLYCTYDKQNMKSKCFCNKHYVGHDCSIPYNPCTHKSHVVHIISNQYVGDRACNVNNGNKCISFNTTLNYGDGYRYRCECDSKAWQPNTTLPFDNCLLQVRKCLSMICIKGTCLSSPSGTKGYCKCDVGYGGSNCNTFVGSWTEWSNWDRCRPACGTNRWTVRTRKCVTASIKSRTDQDISRRDCIGSSTEWIRCADRFCAEEEMNLMAIVFQLRYVLFLTCLFANLMIGLIIVILWRLFFQGVIRCQWRLALNGIVDTVNEMKMKKRTQS